MKDSTITIKAILAPDMPLSLQQTAQANKCDDDSITIKKIKKEYKCFNII